MAEIESGPEKENGLPVDDEGVTSSKTTELEPSNKAACEVLPPPIKEGGKQNEGTVDEDQEGEEAAELSLCLCFTSGFLGIAAFEEVSSVMYIGQVPAPYDELPFLVEGIKTGALPKMIIIPDTMAAKEDIVQLISAPVLEGGGSDFDFKSMKNAYFEPTSAVSTICNHLQVKELLVGRPHPVDSSGAYNLLSSIIDFSAEQLVRALGALLVHLQATAFALEPDGAVHVASLREVPWLSCLRTDQLSLKAGRPKEGFSLFSLLDRTNSGYATILATALPSSLITNPNPIKFLQQQKRLSNSPHRPGRRELRNWIAAPSTDINVISARQDCIELFSGAENTGLVSKLATQLWKVSDIPRVLLRIKRVAALPKHWSSLAVSMEAAILSRDTLIALLRRAPCPEATKLLEWLISLIDPFEVNTVRSTITDVIDIDATASSGEITVRMGVCSRLDSLRSDFSSLPDALRAVGRLILDETEMPQLSVEYLSQIGFLVTFPEEFASYAPNSFEFCFRANGQLFCKCERVRQLDEGIGDIQAQIADAQAEILRGIEDAVLRKEVSLQSAAGALAEVDALLALALSARDLILVRPSVVPESVIYIKGGRHPLQEMVVENFIPNDTALGGNRPSVNIITGPNFSGKSVYIKQVGLLVLLDHVGAFLPCERAVIGLTDRVFTRITSVESCSLPQSSFAIDASQVSKMLRNMTPRSLLLLDEFGKGTAPADGVALVAAVIRSLSTPPPNECCKALVSLHFFELIHRDLLAVKRCEQNAEEEEIPSSTNVVQHGKEIGDQMKRIAAPSCDFRLSNAASNHQEAAAQTKTAAAAAGESATSLDGVAAFQVVHIPTTNPPSLGEKGGETHNQTTDSMDAALASPVPLFKLAPGIATSSYGIACAKAAGLPQCIISRAASIIGNVETGKEPCRNTGTSLDPSILLENSTVTRALRLFLERRGGWEDVENIPTADYEEISSALQDLAQLPIFSSPS